MNAHKKNPQKCKKNKDDLPSNSESKNYWLVVFLYFLGSQEEEGEDSAFFIFFPNINFYTSKFLRPKIGKGGIASV